MRLAVLGASGHGKVVVDAASLAGWTSIDVFDDKWPGVSAIGPWAIQGTTETLLQRRHDYVAAVVAIGDNATRLSKHRELQGGGLRLGTIVHPAAVVSPYARLGEGSVILAGAVINAFARLGEACIVNTGASVDHDCELADAVHISPGAHLGGAVTVGALTWIGIGASVRECIRIGARAIVGAGAAVIADVEDAQTVVGVPAGPRSC